MARQTLNPASLAGLFTREFTLCRVKEGETVALLTDHNTSKDYVLAAFAAAEALGASVFELCIPRPVDLSMVKNRSPADAPAVMQALKSANLVCTFFPPNLSRWLQELQASGGRILSIIASPDQLAKLISPAGLKEAVLHAGERYRAARTIRVTSEAGTDLTWTRGRPGDTDLRTYYGFADEPGRFDQWGFGMVADFPDEGSANGTVVVKPGDVWILPYIRVVEGPVRLEVRDGFIRKVEGGLDAKAFRDWLDRNKRDADDLDPYAVSHLGFGLHPHAHWDGILLHGNSHDDLAVSMRVFAGNFLFSTGPGFKRKTSGHIDMPMCDCSFALDGDTVVERGRLVDPRMRIPAGG
jgi:2,5-dihydroxypyridine 5,6-dioxygenase